MIKDSLKDVIKFFLLWIPTFILFGLFVTGVPDKAFVVSAFGVTIYVYLRSQYDIRQAKQLILQQGYNFNIQIADISKWANILDDKIVDLQRNVQVIDDVDDDVQDLQSEILDIHQTLATIAAEIKVINETRI